MSNCTAPRHQRILVVDDNPAIHADFAKILGPASDEDLELQAAEAKIFGLSQRTAFEVDFASQGQEALSLVERALAEQRPYALVFMDVRMPPGWDGIETLGRLWKVCPELQAVICTAYSDCTWDEMQERINPGDRLLILKKPFDSIEVLQFANALTEKWRLQEESKNRLADLDQLVRQRTEQLEESKGQALQVMADAVRSREEEHRAHEALKREVSQRTWLEEKTREQASLLDKARDAIFVRGIDDRLTYWNRSAESLYGWTAREAPVSKVCDLLQCEPAVYAEAERSVLETGEWVGELWQASAQGEKLLVESRWSLVLDSLGRPAAILTINTDITEKKKLESHLLRAQRMESIGTLAGGIAHDLNNVLLPIMMSIDLMKLLKLEPKALDLLSTIESSTRRGAEMVKQVLLFGRGADGERLRIQPAEVIREVQKIIQDTFPKNITLRTHVEPNLPTFLGDATQIHQVLLNLCVNARDAMPTGGFLDIGVGEVMVDTAYSQAVAGAKHGRYVVMRIVDDGTGMPDDVRAKIFDPFFTTKPVGKGTGLGLSTVAAIVKSHGGFINVYSELGGGTSFKVHFPVAEAAGASFSQPEVEEVLPRGRGEMVLVVDDEEAIRTLVSQTLETFGYRVITANDGTEAVALYAQHRKAVDVVLTDMMMPVMDGLSTIDALRRFNPQLPIVAASGLNTRGGPAKATAVGAQAFLAKPYTAATILTVLRQVLQEAAKKRLPQAEGPAARPFETGLGECGLLPRKVAVGVATPQGFEP